MVARILTGIFCVTLFTGCASQIAQLPPSAEDPANPNAPESPFIPGADWLRTDISVTTEKPAEVPLPESIPTTPAIYTCPMHPEVVQSGPGRCPDCGMRLTPKEPPKPVPGNNQ